MKLGKTYEPEKFEGDIYALWETSHAFKPKNRGGEGHFSVVMPPPNANANLHIGYALVSALEDTIVRYHRMTGKETLLLPGVDHAGFETQAVFEKHLAKNGESRFDYSRDELYKKIWDFVAGNREVASTQMRKLGVSADWSRFTFTLDKKIVRRAYQTFKKMWDDGLIYRGERLVNYCTFHGTGFADIEVEYKNEKSNLWHIRYPLTDGSGEVVVATTRPETMFGDVAVAVHPNDKRYKKYIGKTVKLPLTDREVPIIGDEMVETEFGTGAVKITPAHDQNDFDVAQRHDLPLLTVIDFTGKMNHHVPEPFVGLDTTEARASTVSALKDQGLLVIEEAYEHSVGHCYKCGTVIQPLLREQWFVDMQPLAGRAIKALENGDVTFYPAQKKDQLIQYLRGLKDWNISRQIAWGIPIPAFQSLENPEKWIFDERVDEEIIEVDGVSYRRDPDVFDTWFSSSSWPYATLDFPDGDDFSSFYPLSLMETGGEILYPWVSRMIMLGLYVTNKVPFKDVYIHGYVMAEDGSKMSKSVGNVIDPLPVIDSFGTDALRMGLIAGRAPAVNRGYDTAKVRGARNFCNKIWNIARYVERVAGDDFTQSEAVKPASIADYWMLSKLQQSIQTVTSYLETYKFAEAYDAVYHLIWDDFADWYIEASKVEPNIRLLTHVLEISLKLLHPFAPFVTETIWQTLPWEKSLLMTSPWPMPAASETSEAEQFEQLQKLIVEVRSINSAVGASLETAYTASDNELSKHTALFDHLSGIRVLTESQEPSGVKLEQGPFALWLALNKQSQADLLKALNSKRVQLKKEVKSLASRLKNKSYVTHAPKHLVEETTIQLRQKRVQVDETKATIKLFS